MTDRLLPYYNDELEYLRRFGAEFSKQHPQDRWPFAARRRPLGRPARFTRD